MYSVEPRIYLVNCTYLNAILFEIIDPTLQYLFFRLFKSRLEGKINRKTE